MLHAAPTSESKAETAQSKTQVVPQPKGELHPHMLSPVGLHPSGEMSRIGSSASPQIQRLHALTGMQSSCGNQAVLRILHSPKQVAGMAPLRPSQGIMLQRKCACGASLEAESECSECKSKREAISQSSNPSADVSPKLVVNKPEDRYEQEADSVAEQVMGIPETDIQRQKSGKEGVMLNSKIFFGQMMPLVQRQDDQNQSDQQNAPMADEKVTDEELEEMEEANVAPLLQRKPLSGATDKTKDEQISLRSALARQSEGRPLDGMTRSLMESRFGHDFSQVRIHTNEHADKAARSIHARAFTVGQNIWFAYREFSPDTHAGRHLLAHELTHTIQQRSKSVSAIQRSICPDHCKAPVSAGRLCEARKVTRDNCGMRDAKDTRNMITHIRVLITPRKVQLFWNGEPNTCKGAKTEIDCTPNPNPKKGTPRVRSKIGHKCGINHTSYPGKKSKKIHNMAYFTEFHGGMRYGFHDSQPLGAGFHSSGCVRVSCENARLINENTSSGKTTVVVQDRETDDCKTIDIPTIRRFLRSLLALIPFG